MNWITTELYCVVKAVVSWIFHAAITIAAQRYLIREYRIIGTY